jgi:hypothetical protein
MRQYRFYLGLSHDQVLAFYQGYITAVQVLTEEGLRLQLDLVHFRRFFTHTGVSGYFVLTTSATGKFIRLEKIN